MSSKESIILQCVDLDALEVFISDQNEVSELQELNNKDPMPKLVAVEVFLSTVLKNTDFSKEDWEKAATIVNVISEAAQLYVENRLNYTVDDSIKEVH